MGCGLSTIVFQPPHPSSRSSSSSLTLTTLHGNRIPAAFINGDHHQTLLISHGNAEDLPRVEDWVRRVMVPRLKANFLLYEYSGYGLTDAEASESFVYSDCEAALWFLTSCLRLPLESIVLYGRSLGSGPACYIAERHPQIAGLILQTPITSVYRVIVDFRCTMPGDMFANIDRMQRISCPVLLLHGTRDEIVPMSHSERLMDACPHKNKLLMLVEGAGHNNLESVSGPPIFQVIQNFLDSLQDKANSN